MPRIYSFRFRSPLLFLVGALLVSVFSASAQPPGGPHRRFDRAVRPAERDDHATTTTTAAPPATPPRALTRQTITLPSGPLDYTAEAATMPLTDESGKPQATIFYVAYTKGHGAPDPSRPLLFAFNGGPGAAAVWLHLGGIGPRRTRMERDGTVLPERFELDDNPETWLDRADLVFVDPVGTGFSRAAQGAEARRFYEYQEDVRTLAAFIRLYLTRNGRWLSPLYLAGESYGATRAAAVAQRLQSSLGIYPRGVILISSVLDFLMLSPGDGNDLPYALDLPTCAATAWYHHKLGPDLQADLDKTLAEAERWAIADYLPALARGDALPASDADRVAERLAAFTGLPERVIRNHNLRIDTADFARELLRDQNRFLGFMDGRVVGVPTSGASQFEPYDPAFFLAIGPIVATFNDYVRRTLGYHSDLDYEYLSGDVHGAWRYGAEGRTLNVTDKLRQAMVADTRLRVFNATGAYDLTTPYFTQRYSMDHLGLDPSLRGNIVFRRYPAGHQIYTSKEALAALKRDAVEFIK